MDSAPRRPRKRTLAGALALVGVCVLMLCAGAPGLLVICNGPQCKDALELLHLRGCDCGPGPATKSSGHSRDSAGSPVLRKADCGCSDVAFRLPSAPLPQRVVLPSPQTPCAALPIAVPVVMRPPTLVLHPPNIGPPRIDRTTVLRASTLLLI